MKIVVTGSRHHTGFKLIWDALMEHTPTAVPPARPTLIHGNASGADHIAAEIAQQLGWEEVSMPADWETHGRAAGPIRNRQMLDMEPDLVLAFPLDGSSGTWHCVNEAKRRGIPVEVVRREGGTS